jgi:AcrR family transcriptional regulator
MARPKNKSRESLASSKNNDRYRRAGRTRSEPAAAPPSDAKPDLLDLPGLRERKKTKLRNEIVKTSQRLFLERGYENTRIDDIVNVLDVSQPTFFRYFPSKDAVLREIGRRAFARQSEILRSELSSKASTGERLRRFFESLTKITEEGRPLWQAVILVGAMDPVRSPEIREPEEDTVDLLREILAQGQERGDITRNFPVDHLAEFMEGLFTTVVRQWAVDLHGPHKLSDRVANAVEFFLRGTKP